MSFASRPLRCALCAFHVLFLLAFQVGCRNENRFQELRLSTVEDSPSLSQLKTQASFRAQLVEVNILFETNSFPANVPSGTSNFYQFVLRDQSGREQVFAGINAPMSDLQALKSLESTKAYTFPDVLKERGK